MSFTVGPASTTTFTTELDISSSVLECTETVTLEVLGGELESVTDGSNGCYYTVISMDIADVENIDCDGSTLNLKDVEILNDGDSMEAVIPAQGGTITGNQSIQITGTAYGSNFPVVGTLDDTVLEDFTGTLPDGGSNGATFSGNSTTLTYNDTTHVVATAAPTVVIVTVNITLTGLQGSLTLDLP